MPLDYFRTNGNLKTNNVNGNNNYVGNYGMGTNLLMDLKAKQEKIDSLERELDSMRGIIESQKATIASKEDTNTVLKNYIESLKNQLEEKR